MSASSDRRLNALHLHRKAMGSIPARGPIVGEFFSTVPGLIFDMCMIPLELKRHLPFRIYPTSSEVAQNLAGCIKPQFSLNGG